MYSVGLLLLSLAPGTLHMGRRSFVWSVHMGASYVAVRLTGLTTSHLYELIGMVLANVCNLLLICRVPAAVSPYNQP